MRRVLAIVLCVLLLSPSLAIATNCAIFQTFQSGDSLTASGLNSIQSTLNNNISPACSDDASANQSAMETTVDPNSSGSVSLPTTSMIVLPGIWVSSSI